VAPSSDTWQRLQDEHLDAVERFLTLARSVTPSRWSLAPAAARWSPVQVTEHVALTYETLLQEVLGGAAMRLRMRWWQRALLKVLLLPHILRTGRIPSGAVAPRELRPGSDALDQAALVERLRAGARRLEEELVARRTSAHLTHPYFGRLQAADVLRFCAIHTTHHAEQLWRAPEATD